MTGGPVGGSEASQAHSLPHQMSQLSSHKHKRRMRLLARCRPSPSEENRGKLLTKPRGPANNAGH